jgi:TM2 domain-containing membrane protein YozV
MTAQGFGRKGAAAGALAPRRGQLVAGQQPRSFQPMKGVEDPGADAAERRAAFLAGERARNGAPAPAAAALPSAEAEAAAAALKAVTAPPPTDRSLKAAYAIWFLLGLAGGHRFYLRRPYTGAIQFGLLAGCIGEVAIFQYYPAFAGLALSWAWYLADGIRLRQLHLWSGPR